MKDISFVKLAPFLVLILIGGAVGFFIGHSNSIPTPPRLPNAPVKEVIPRNPLFKSQSATFEGEITKVEGSNLSVKSDDGQTGKLIAASNMLVYGSGPKKIVPEIATSSASIALNKMAILTLELVNGEYQVTSISYPPAPPPPLAPKQ